MDLAFLDQLQAALQGVNPLWAAILGVVIILIRQGKIRLPKFTASAPADTVAPLKSRLADVLAKRFEEIREDGFDEDDAYVVLLDRIKAPIVDKEDEPEKAE